MPRKTVRQRCEKHPRRWVIFEWVWREGSSEEDSDARLFRGCKLCDEEVEYDDLLEE